MLATVAARANVTWGATSNNYDFAGNSPSASVSIDFHTGKLVDTEVHTSGLSPFPIWFHPETLYPQFGVSSVLSNSSNAGSTATVGDDQSGRFITVYTDAQNQMWSAIMDTAVHTDRWGASASLGQGGYYPSVSAAGAQLDNYGDPTGALVVEAHQGQVGAGSLWFDVGWSNTYGTDYATAERNNWFDFTGVSPWVAGHYTDGARPSVSIIGAGRDPTTRDAQYLVAEVHQAEADVIYGPLWSDIGLLTIPRDGSHSWKLSWFSTLQFTNGEFPSIAICGINGESFDPFGGGPKRWTVVQVNQGLNGSLWSHTGTVTQSDSTTWSFQWDSGSDQNYDNNGYMPNVSCSKMYFDQSTYTFPGMEVHEDNGGRLWSRTFSTPVR
jgi:hypothetical protein